MPLSHMPCRGHSALVFPTCRYAALPLQCPFVKSFNGSGERDGRMDYFVQQLINGITLGSIYGLIAIGYTMVFGIIGMVNFAHGDVFMVSAFIALILFMLLTQVLGLGSLPVAFIVPSEIGRRR